MDPAVLRGLRSRVQAEHMSSSIERAGRSLARRLRALSKKARKERVREISRIMADPRSMQRVSDTRFEARARKQRDWIVTVGDLVQE